MKCWKMTYHPIDLVVANLYPFESVTANPDTSLETAIENIDIGGPTMIRAAAKNFAHTAVVVDSNDYYSNFDGNGGIWRDTQRDSHAAGVKSLQENLTI